jgi:Xaa-Pro aminopeptidase
VISGEPLLLDFGAYVDGYCSDLTRTVVLGRADDRLREMYAHVRAAQSAAETALMEGVRRGRDIDAAARQVLVDAGLGEYYIHSTGHGVGMAVHELPSLAYAHPVRDPEGIQLAKVEGLLPGHVVTVEPGVYFPDWGGVREEDMLLITENGAELLCSRNPEQIREIG